MTIFPPLGQGAVDAIPVRSENFPFVANNELVPLIDQLSVFLYDKPLKFLRIGHIAGLGEDPSGIDVPVMTNEVDLVLLDTAGDTIVDTRAMLLTATLWYDDIWHMSWKSRYECVQMICRRGSSLKTVYAPANAYIDARCVHTCALGINRVEVFSGGYWVPALRSDGTLRLRSGYNMEMTSKINFSERGERVFDLSLAAEPGAGLGKFEGCLASAPIRKIAGQGPSDAGDFFLTGDPCLVVKPSLTFSGDTVTVVGGKIELDDLCTPPCTCDDFTQVYQYAKRVWGSLKRIAERSEQIRDDYHQVRAIWENLAQCAESNLIRVKAWPQNGCGVVGIVGFCNPTDEPMYDIVLKISASNDADESIGGSIPCESVSRVDYSQGDNFPAPYSFEEPFPNAKVKLKCIPPGQMSYVSFRFTPDGLADGDKVRLCVELDGDPPEGVRAQSRRCYDATLMCQSPDNCGDFAAATTTTSTTTEAPGGG